MMHQPLPTLTTFNGNLPKVTEETVMTKEGRAAYFQFLQKHQNAPSIVKLYGLKGSPENDETKIDQHCKKLYKHIHPDKVLADEKDLCTQLFHIIHQAEEDLQEKLQFSNQTFFRGTSSHNFFNPLRDPCQRLWDYLHMEKWSLGIDLLKKINLSFLKDNHQLSLLAYVFFIRTGQPQELKDILVEKFSSLRKILLVLEEENLQKDITKKVAKERVDYLQQILKEIRNLQQQETEQYDQLFELILPHFFFIQLKKYYCLLGDTLNLEISLREAIRHCPSLFYEEKKNLILELEKLIQNYRPEFQDRLDVKIEMKNLINNFTRNISEEMGRFAYLCNHYTYFNIIGEMELFERSYNICHIKKAISYVETMLSLPYCIAILLLNTGFQFPSGETLTQWLNTLKGIKFYLKDDKNQACIHFSNASHFQGRGLMEFELHRYADAINSFNQLREKQVVARYIYHTLNFHDTLNVAEESSFQYQHIREVDSIQISAIRSLEKY